MNIVVDGQQSYKQHFDHKNLTGHMGQDIVCVCKPIQMDNSYRYDSQLYRYLIHKLIPKDILHHLNILLLEVESLVYNNRKDFHHNRMNNDIVVDGEQVDIEHWNHMVFELCMD